MREYIFTRNEIQKIKQFHQDGRKTQAIRLLKHRCEGLKVELEDDIQVLNDFLNDYENPEPPCFGTDKVREVHLDCLKCAAQARCVTAYVKAQREKGMVDISRGKVNA